jgi:hypothetical protein
MKNNRRLDLVALPLLLLAFFVASCKTTTPEQVAYRTIGTIVHSVDGAMKGWGDWVRNGHASAAQQVQVQTSYERYQAVMRVARSVMGTVTTRPESQAYIESAVEAAQNAADELLAVISKFVHKEAP